MNQHKKKMPFLPVEICLLICEYLDRPSLKCARLISRSFASAAEPKLFEVFHLRCNADRFQKLHDISCHDRIRRFVKKIHYETRLYNDCAFDFWSSLPLVQPITPNGLEATHLDYRNYVKEQIELSSPDTQVKRLSSAVQNFPNLVTLCLDNCATVASKPPDFLKHLDPIGSQALQPRLIVRPSAEEEFAAISIAAKSVLTMGIQELSLAGYGLDYFCDIDLPNVAPDVLWQFLGQLRGLEIDLHQYLHRYKSKLTHMEFCSLAELLKRSRNLSKLNIFFGQLPESWSDSKDLLQFLAPSSSVFMDRVTKSQPQWALTELRLGELTISSVRLLAMLQNTSDTLRSLELFNIGLSEKYGGADDVRAGLTTHSWIFVMKSLPEMLHLTHVEFGGYLTNLQTESWKVAAPGDENEELAGHARNLGMKQRVKNYVLRKGPCPFSRKPGREGDIQQWSQEDIDEFTNSKRQKLPDGGRRFLLWDFEDDDSWRFDCDAWEHYNYQNSITV